MVFEPIGGDDEPETGVAWELNRMADGMALDPTADVAGGSPGDFPPAPPSDSVGGKLLWELCQVVEAAGLGPSDPALRLDSRPVVEATASVADPFEDGPDGYEPPEEEWAASRTLESPPSPARPRFDPIEPPSDDIVDVAEALNRMAERAPADPAAVQAVIAPWVPIEVPADPESGIAYAEALNRASEGLDLAAREPGRSHDPDRPIMPGDDRSTTVPGSSSVRVHRIDTRDFPGTAVTPRAPGDARPQAAGPRLDRALHLTREAASAWMDILTGPVLTRMTSR